MNTAAPTGRATREKETEMTDTQNAERIRTAVANAARQAGQHFTSTQINNLPAHLVAGALAASNGTDAEQDGITKGAERARHRSASSTAKRVDL